MRRRKASLPSAVSVRGRARLRLAGRTFYLGPYGSREARSLEDRIVGLWLAHGRAFPPGFSPVEEGESDQATPLTQAPSEPAATPVTIPPDHPLSVGELCHRWIEWIKAERVIEGRDTSLLDGARQASHALRRHWPMPAAEFGPRSLAEVRTALANEPCRPAGKKKPSKAKDGAALRPAKKKPPRPPRFRARTTVNDTVGRIRQLFRWAVSRELVPPDRVQALASLEPLMPGQTRAVERGPVMSVPDDVFEATVKRLPPVVADLVRVIRLTGCRPGEICRMRPQDIDMRGDVWTYTPARHKNDWRSHKRSVAIGPKAQMILRRYIGQGSIDKPVFSPRLSERMRGRKPSRIVRDHYDNDEVCRAVVRACEKFSLPRWTPNQLRHSRLEEVRDTFGLDHAQAVGGHKHARVTEIYAGVNTRKAVEVALRTG